MGVGMLAALVMGSAGTALADSGGGSVTVDAGSLSETINSILINSGSHVSLNGTDQNISIALPITVKDPTGSGDGWNVTIKASQFTGTGDSSHVLPAPTVSAVSFTDVTNTTDTDPTNTITDYSNFSVPTGSTPSPLFSAASGTGMGAFTLNPTMTVKVPANAIPDTYSSTFTLAVAAGPSA